MSGNRLETPGQAKRRLVLASCLSVFFLSTLVADFLLLPISSPRGVSSVGVFRETRISRTTVPLYRRVTQHYRIEAIPTGEQDWRLRNITGGSSRSGPYWPGECLVLIVISWAPDGFWAPAHVRSAYAWREPTFGNTTLFSGPWAPGLAEATIAFAEEHFGSDVASLVEASVNSEPPLARLYWPGVIHNIASVAALIGLLVSLRTAILTLLWILRSKPGHCSRCRYDLSGATGSVCPECGSPREAGGEV